MNRTATGVVLWFTGLSGAGKTTLARGVEAALRTSGREVRLLDGDELRRTISADLGFSRADRDENVRRIAALAKREADAGHWVIVAAISPYLARRVALAARVSPTSSSRSTSRRRWWSVRPATRRGCTPVRGAGSSLASRGSTIPTNRRLAKHRPRS